MVPANRLLRGGVLVLLLLLFAFFLYKSYENVPQGPVKEKRVKFSLKKSLQKLPSRKFEIVKLKGFPYGHFILYVDLPVETERVVRKILEKANIAYRELSYHNMFYFRLLRPRENLSAIIVKKFYRTPVLGLLIDDVGNKWKLLKKLAEVNEPISLAVFPFEVFSKRSAEYLVKKGYQILLHLPLEPIHYKDPRMIKGMLLTSMSANEMESIVGEAIGNLPGIVGVNNHIGSKFTSDPVAMDKLLKILAKNSLFYIDSFTIAKSVAWKEAFKLGVPTAKRDVFIDNSLNKEEIVKMWDKAVKIALKRKRVLVIGHLHPQTVEVVLEKLPELKSKGVLPVYVSELLF